jgi:CelD/BcsL family acetyltransferase involved in cellulose biosynthesis
LPNILSLMPIRADGAVMPVLCRVLALRRAPLRIFAKRQRPLLNSGADGKIYLGAALSSSSRKKLRQHRRRLAERGALTSRTHLTLTDICAAFEDFLTLEASGWKGRRGDALSRTSSDVAYARGMIAALAARSDVRIYALYLDDRPVSMQIVLCAGAAAFTWKTAYDENLHDFSPGMLLLEDYTTAFLADPRIAFVDSCSFDDSGYMAVWSEREALADLWIDAHRGGSPGFALCAQAQYLMVALRDRLKRLYGTGMRTWKKLTS